MWVRSLFTEGLFQVELESSKGLGRAASSRPWFVTLLKFFPTRFLLVPRHSASSPPKDIFSLDGPFLLTKDPAPRRQ